MTKTVTEALQWAKAELAQGESPLLDARILLARSINQSLTYLFTWPEAILTDAQWRTFCAFIERRQKGEPIAYISGERDFWSLSLAVNPATLIPRPETELLVELALARLPSSRPTVCDLGTGTGAVALAIATERPDALITGVDVVPAAVSLAKENAKRNKLEHVCFVHSEWFSALSDKRFDMIVSNPPYVEETSAFLQEGDVRFEPKSALTSGPDGLKDIKIIIEQAPDWLHHQGWLLLEHGYQQGQAVHTFFNQRGFHQVTTVKDGSGHDRITMGLWRTC
ncbi:peptide chain release factor N(5)-glutamine methyltransferase [Alteromonas pelagimontana]|uniref:Release factor glutamine methyltransferase n=1 Tax=Alteromonas pelagimontana TaxID=1858656 RepID=A0A6M4M947_9ALTE|nr:peptide chain release factor N(5)-glutamine methyltransferase [Alteromonas pelagimontana]QJR79692.1 peptide chain release factor N(5)-glutamine methyltransferase [Alteromonas pelagimontana]